MLCRDKIVGIKIMTSKKLHWKERVVYYWNKIFYPRKNEQIAQLNELVLTNSKRLEQALQEIEKQNFEEAQRIFTLMRYSLDIFEKDATFREIRKNIRIQRRQLALDEKIRDMDDFLTYSNYQEIKEQIITLFNAKKFRPALEESRELLFLLQDIETKFQKYNLLVPSQIEDQYKEVKLLNNELREKYKPEEK